MGKGSLIAGVTGGFALATVASCVGFAAPAFAPAAAPVARVVAVPMTGSVVLAVDGTLRYSMPPTCDVRPDDVSVSATAVTVRLTRVTTIPFVCPASGTPLTVTFPLNEPLGDRPVIDATSGATLPVFVERGALHPNGPGLLGFTPLGYGLDGSLAPGFGGPGSATLGEAFLEPGGPQDQRAILWIVQTTGHWNRPPGLVTTPVTVRGHRGEQAQGILVWTENGQTVAVVYLPPPGRGPNGPRLLDIANRLVRTDVAR